MGLTKINKLSNMEKYEGKTVADICNQYQTLSKRVTETIELLKHQDINGCITGSCLITDNFEDWGSVPDIDIFVYSEQEMLYAVSLLQYKLGLKPGTSDTGKSTQQEQWKLDRLRQHGKKKDAFLATAKFYYKDIVVNVTYKKSCDSLINVLTTFDMTIVMQGYDIKGMYYLDLRGDNTKLAQPNPLRNQDCTLWNVDKWTRQFDRVVKYYDRGFDTRPMAEFYLSMIDEVLKVGSLWTSPESIKTFETFSAQFVIKREQIQTWLDEHKED